MTKVRDYLILVGGAGVVVSLDQLTKFLVRTRLDVGQTWMPLSWLAPYARVIHWSNTGAAFGMLPSGSLFFTLVAIVVSAAILYYFPRVPSGETALRVALALQLGGAVGNLVDRVIQGTVTDFISVGSFPVFNLADSSISIGVAVLIVAMWVGDRRERASRAQAGSPPASGAGEGDSHVERRLG